MEISEKPINIHFCFLRATKKECIHYAENWLSNLKSKKGWIYLEKFNDGFLVECQNDGEGKAFLPEIIESKGSYGTINMGDHYLVVELNKKDIRTIQYDELEEDEDSTLKPSKPMTPVIIDSSSHLFSASLACFMIAVATALVAFSAMPAPAVVVTPNGNGNIEPYTWWLNEAHWGRDQTPTKVVYRKNSGWKIEDGRNDNE